MTTKSNEKVVTLERYLELKDQNYEFDGYSYLFWEYIRLLNEVKPKYFLLENVKMKKEWEYVLNNVIGFEPIKIDSALVSAQTRKRLYWVGKKNKNNNYEKIEIPQPLDRGLIVKDILDYGNLKNEYVPYGVDKRYKRYFDKYNNIPQHFCAYSNKDVSTKTPTITTHSGSGSGSGAVTSILPICINSKSGRNGITGLYATNEVPLYEVKNGMIKINDNTFPIKLSDGYYVIRKLSPLEYERLQTLDDNYTDCISNNQRYKCIGNGWTVEVIKHILSYTL